MFGWIRKKDVHLMMDIQQFKLQLQIDAMHEEILRNREWIQDIYSIILNDPVKHNLIEASIRRMIERKKIFGGHIGS